jgi:hypothetical protein
MPTRTPTDLFGPASDTFDPAFRHTSFSVFAANDPTDTLTSQCEVFVPDVSSAPVLQPSSQPSTNLTYAAVGMFPIGVGALENRSSAARDLTGVVSAPPWSVAISLIYIVGLLGTAIYLFLSLVLTN